MSVRGAVCVRVSVRVLLAAPEVRFQLPFVAVWTFYARAPLRGFPLTGTRVRPESPSYEVSENQSASRGGAGAQKQLRSEPGR